MFYSDPSTATRIIDKISGSGALLKVLEDKLVEKTIFDNIDSPPYTQLEAMSDKSWPPKLQRN